MSKDFFESNAIEDMMKVWSSMSVQNLFPIYRKNINLRPVIEDALIIAMRHDDVALLKSMTIGREAQEEIIDSII